MVRWKIDLRGSHCYQGKNQRQIPRVESLSVRGEDDLSTLVGGYVLSVRGEADFLGFDLGHWAIDLFLFHHSLGYKALGLDYHHLDFRGLNGSHHVQYSS